MPHAALMLALRGDFHFAARVDGRTKTAASGFPSASAVSEIQLSWAKSVLEYSRGEVEAGLDEMGGHL
jgi:hypothetical protein